MRFRVVVEAVAVRIGSKRIASGLEDLEGIGQSIAVGVRGEEVGPRLMFLAVAEAVAVGVGILRIRSVDLLFQGIG